MAIFDFGFDGQPLEVILFHCLGVEALKLAQALLLYLLLDLEENLDLSLLLRFGVLQLYLVLLLQSSVVILFLNFVIFEMPFYLRNDDILLKPLVLFLMLRIEVKALFLLRCFLFSLYFRAVMNLFHLLL